MSTTLQAALISAGITSLDFYCEQQPYSVKVSDLPDVTLKMVLDYGARRKLNDAVNTAMYNAKKNNVALTKAEALETTLQAFREGTVGQRATITPLQEALRGIVRTQAVKYGYKASEAAKLARAEKEGLREILQTVGKYNAEKFDSLWEAIEKRARAIVAAQQEDFDY